MDRAGLVGADGATHCGAFDITYMATVRLSSHCARIYRSLTTTLYILHPHIL